MATTGTNQPTVFDYAAQTQWRITFDRLPKCSWFCTSTNIPGITLGEAQYATPMQDIVVTGDKLTFETLNVQFIVDEEYENYRELWDWIVGIGFPKQHSQFTEALSGSNRQTLQSLGSSAPSSIGSGGSNTPSETALYSDATMLIYNSKNIAKLELNFKDIFPINLGGLQYTQDATDVEYLKADASFRFLYYDFKVVT